MEKCVLCVALGILYSLSSADECKPTQENKLEFVRCPSNCSQYPPRVDGDEVFFNCSIGIKEDVENYKERNKIQFLPESRIFDAPMIHGVKTYWKQFLPEEFAVKNLMIEFSLPKGIINPKNSNDWRLPKAILLKFEGLTHGYAAIEDRFYSRCPRERIFQFHNYTTNNFYDMVTPIKAPNPFKVVKQRHIVFDCLIGLDGTGYSITLQTAEGKTAKYLTTVSSMSESVWRPAIMTFLNETSQSLHTVVEERPMENITESEHPNLSDITGLRVNLISIGYGVVQTAELRQRNSTIFHNLTKGRYRIEVCPLCRIKCKPSANFSVKSVIIDGSMLPSKERKYPHYLEETLEPMKVVAMVAGCIMGITLLLSITYCIRKRPKCQESHTVPKASGLLLHPFRNDGTNREYDVVLKLERYVNDAFECKVTNSDDFHREHMSNVDNLRNGLNKILKDSSFVLVMCSKNCYKSDATDLINEFYSCALKAVLERRYTHNDIRIIIASFAFNSRNDISSLVATLKIQATYAVDFIDKPEKVYCKIHGLEKCPPNRNITVENMSQWSTTWSELNRSINKVRNNSDVGQNEFEPLLPQGHHLRRIPCGEKSDTGLSQHISIDKKNPFRTLQDINAVAEIESILGEDTVTSDQRFEEAACNNRKLFTLHQKEHFFNNTQNENRTNEQRIKQQSYKKQQQNNNAKRKQNQSNFKKLQAEVHYSLPSEESEEKVLLNEQPFSLPPNFSSHFPSRFGTEYHQEMLKRSGKQKCPSQKTEHSYNLVSGSDSDSCSDDGSLRNEDCFIAEPGPPVNDKLPVCIQSHINHHHRHPHQCQNRVTDHRYPFQCDNGLQHSQFSGQRTIRKKRDVHHRPPLIHHGTNHNHLLHFGHETYQYQPDDYISEIRYHQNASSRTPEHMQYFDHRALFPPNVYVSGEDQQGWFATAGEFSPDRNHGNMHQNHDGIARNGTPGETFQLNPHNQHDESKNSHQDYHYQNHQPYHLQYLHRENHDYAFCLDDVNHHQSTKRDRSDRYWLPTVNQPQNSNNSDSSQSSTLTFEAFDPPDTRQNQSSQSNNYGLSNEKTSGQLQRLGSVSSLPPNFDARSPVANFNNYSPVPPEDIDDIVTDSQEIIDGLDQINKNNI